VGTFQTIDTSEADPTEFR